MPIDFPNSPSTNDTYTFNGRTWKYNGEGWEAVAGTITGDKGGVKYEFSTTTADADPGAGFIRYNNGTIASVTQVFIDNADASGNTQTAWYDTWDDGSGTTKGQLLILGNTTTTVNIFNLTAVTAASGYYKATVTHVSGALPANLEECVVLFLPAYGAVVFG